MASSLLSLGSRTMANASLAMATTGHNIANASVAGYSRQQVELETAIGQFSGSGFFGKGANVATVTRSHDQFLTREAQASAALAAADSARADQLERLEAAFPTGEAGIGYAASRLLDSIVDVASRPGDLASRQVVLSRAEDFAARLRSSGGQLDALQSGVTQDLRNAVGEVNDLASRIAQVNAQIVAVRGVGHEPNDLLDQRDQLVQQLSAKVQVTTVAADDGSLSVFVAGGQRLVLGPDAAKLALVPDAFDPQRAAIAIDDQGTRREIPGALVGGGAIAGLLRFQNDDLAAARNRLGQLGAALAGALNGQQALGLDLAGRDGAPLYAADAARVLPADTNAKTAGGAFVAAPTIAVADAGALQASDYELRGDGAGGWTLTRLADGLQRPVADGDTIDGFTLALGTPAPAATDRFLLQPVARVANEIRRVLDDPRGIAAAAPVTATLSGANTGTASIASLRAADASLDRSLTATITFTSDSGDYAWTLPGGTPASGSARWTPGTPIAINGFELELAGVPRSGDAISVAPTQYPAANNGNALALVALRDQGLVAGSTLGDAWSAAIADIGVRVQGGRTAADISAGVAGAAQGARDNAAGVNLDEEAARLIQYQQSYQAAAKMLQVAQSLFDTLLDATR